MNEERRLAAIMFSDICNFSRIMENNEKRALEIVELAFSCISQAVEQYNGRIIKKIGDGVLCEFSSAVNAVKAAIEVQKAIADYNRNVTQDEQFQLRIGIHVGDVVVADGGDIFGDGVNIASRIEPMAEPGGICISRDVFDMVRNKVSIETVSLG
jgi:class 3 adenylate cyclase